MKRRIEVSPEMVSFVGNGPIDPAPCPARSIGLSFRFADLTVAFHASPADATAMVDADLVFLVAQPACVRLFGDVPTTDARWHLSIDLRAIALAIRDCAVPESARDTFCLAKSIELLCAIFGRLEEGALVPADGAGVLSESDARRIADASRLIDERWHEKLTLDGIARACGLNRAKLTRGFRATFACTVADAIADRRLAGARQMLLATDLPVSAIGYRCGYLNNASFTRAFSRRFGQPPTQMRYGAVAA